MIHVNVKCPHCGKSLMDQTHQIDSHPSIMVMIEHDKKTGALHLSSLYGSYNVDTDLFVPEKKVATFSCSHCHKELKSNRVCEICQAPMIPFNFTSGGVIQICSRRGCKKHIIEFEKLEGELSAFYSEYGPFH